MMDTLHVVREISIQSNVAEEVIDNRAERVTRVIARHESLQCEPCLVSIAVSLQLSSPSGKKGRLVKG